MRIGRRLLFVGTILSWLTGGLVSARAKGPGFGTIVELRDHIVAALKRRPGVDEVTPNPINPAEFEVVMGDWSSVGDVRNIFGYLQAYPEEDATPIIGRFIASIIEAKDVVVKDESIVAVIRKREYVESMPDAGADILHEPFGADLVILYMSDLPSAMVPIDKEALPGRDVASVRATALANLHKWLPKVVTDDTMKVGNLYSVEENPMLSPSLLLLDDFWKSIAPRFPGDVLIALPRRDQLFIFDDDGDPRSRARVRALIDVTIEENFNLLSPMLYARRNGKIAIVSD